MALSPGALEALAMALAGAALILFVWPTIQRLRAQSRGEAAERPRFGSPLWWAGFALIIAALFLQRLAAGG
jgi:hypothetical protein